jgi:hypothetical protein
MAAPMSTIACPTNASSSPRRPSGCRLWSFVSPSPCRSLSDLPQEGARRCGRAASVPSTDAPPSPDPWPARMPDGPPLRSVASGQERSLIERPRTRGGAGTKWSSRKRQWMRSRLRRSSMHRSRGLSFYWTRWAAGVASRSSTPGAIAVPNEISRRGTGWNASTLTSLSAAIVDGFGTSERRSLHGMAARCWRSERLIPGRGEPGGQLTSSSRPPAATTGPTHRRYDPISTRSAFVTGSWPGSSASRRWRRWRGSRMRVLRRAVSAVAVAVATALAVATPSGAFADSTVDQVMWANCQKGVLWLVGVRCGGVELARRHRHAVQHDKSVGVWHQR